MNINSGAWIDVAAVEELPETGLHRFRGETADVLICAVEGEFSAVRNECSHQSRPLHMGRIRGGQLYCPVHGASFDPKTGAPCSAPATTPLTTYPIRVVDGILQIALSD